MANEEKKETQLTCESCGKEFFCGAETGNCWCFEVKLEAVELENLLQKFANCLCADCLKNKTELS
jgi:hypothetical protein